MKTEDINFLRRELNVRRQVQHKVGGGLEIRPPNLGSERIVFLPDGLVQMLARHLEQFGVGTEGWLVMSNNGTALPPTRRTVGGSRPAHPSGPAT